MANIRLGWGKVSFSKNKEEINLNTKKVNLKPSLFSDDFSASRQLRSDLTILAIFQYWKQGRNERIFEKGRGKK